MAHRKPATKGGLMGEWASPTIATFADQESRDGFLCSVAATAGIAYEVKPVAEDGRVAWVRWRAGHFLSLNDMAYAQRGRITVPAVPRTGVSAPGVNNGRGYLRLASR